jgi:peptidoglycan/LPS O-acetylase OafA/YrhL
VVAKWLDGRFAAPLLLVLLVLITNLLPDDIRGLGRLSIHLCMLFLLASTVVREDNGLRALLTFPLVARIGALSYGIYLLHHVAIGVVDKGLHEARVGEAPLASFFLGGALTLGIAELSYRFYETRFLKLRERFR